ncbi:hypothetical protein J8273_2167 [Carpediemonas membranifera]|uniref:TmcB/TmcC TPR repeats domain-containing protein n=1 Tax=Carpediemonas membranifera TaxID=201153 RepID=A0A8J6AWA3_9EUKA|nr:hypothetical protein J8273_2167 [Carpediemonas membranifera]|eukprot:KAG9396436.1 hypothetical protein J8273_2167 [Carpediemonas membranifera]
MPRQRVELGPDILRTDAHARGSSRMSTMSFTRDSFQRTSAGRASWLVLRLTMAVRSMGMRFPSSMHAISPVIALYFLSGVIVQADDVLGKYLGSLFPVPSLYSSLLTDYTSQVLIWGVAAFYWSLVIALILFVAVGKSVVPHNVAVSQLITSCHRLISGPLFIPAACALFQLHRLDAPLDGITVISNPVGWGAAVISVTTLVAVTTVVRLSYFNYDPTPALTRRTQLPSMLALAQPAGVAMYSIALTELGTSSTVATTVMAVLPVVWGVLLFVLPMHAHPATVAVDVSAPVCAGLAAAAVRCGWGLFMLPAIVIIYILVYTLIIVRYMLLSHKYRPVVRPHGEENSQPVSAESQTRVPPGILTTQSLFFYAYCRSFFGKLSMSQIRQTRDRLEFLSFMQQDNTDANRISEIHQIGVILEAVTVNAGTHYGPTMNSRVNLIIFIQYVRANTDAAIFEIFRAFDHARTSLDLVAGVYLYALYQNAENSRRNQHTGFDSAMLRRLHVKLKTVQRQVMQAKLAINTFWSILSRDKVDILELHRVSEQIYAHATSAERTFIWLLEYFPQRIPVIRMYADFLRGVVLAPDAAEKLDSYAEYLNAKDRSDTNIDLAGADYRVEFEHNRVLKARKAGRRSPLMTRLQLTIGAALIAIGAVVVVFLLFESGHAYIEHELRGLHQAATELSVHVSEADYLIQAIAQTEVPTHPFESTTPTAGRLGEAAAAITKAVGGMYSGSRSPAVQWTWPDLPAMLLAYQMLQDDTVPGSTDPAAVFSGRTVRVTCLVDLLTYVGDFADRIVSGSTLTAAEAYFAHTNIAHQIQPQLAFFITEVDHAVRQAYVADVIAVAGSCGAVICLLFLVFPLLFIQPVILVKQAQERNLNLFMRMDKGLAAMMARSTDLHRSAGYIPTADELVANSDRPADRSRDASMRSNPAIGSRVSLAASLVFDSSDESIPLDMSFQSVSQSSRDSGPDSDDDEQPHSPGRRPFANVQVDGQMTVPQRQSSQDHAKLMIANETQRFMRIRRRSVQLLMIAGCLLLGASILSTVVIGATALLPHFVESYGSVYKSSMDAITAFHSLLVAENNMSTAVIGYVQALETHFIEEYRAMLDGGAVDALVDNITQLGMTKDVVGTLAATETDMHAKLRVEAISLYQSANAAGASLPTSSQCFLSGMAYNYTAEPTHLLQALVYNSSRSRGYYSDAGADAMLSTNDSLRVARNILVDPAYLTLVDAVDTGLLAARDAVIDANKANVNSAKVHRNMVEGVTTACFVAVAPIALLAAPVILTVMVINIKLSASNGRIVVLQDWVITNPGLPFQPGAKAPVHRQHLWLKLLVVGLATGLLLALSAGMVATETMWSWQADEFQIDAYEDLHGFFVGMTSDITEMSHRVLVAARYAQFADVALGYHAMAQLQAWSDTVEGLAAGVAVLEGRGGSQFDEHLARAGARLEAAVKASASIEHILRISFQLATEAAGLATSLPLPHYSYDASTEDDAAEDALHYPARVGHMYSSDTADGLLDADVQMEMARLLLFDEKMAELKAAFEEAVTEGTSILAAAVDEVDISSNTDGAGQTVTALTAFTTAVTIAAYGGFLFGYIRPPKISWALKGMQHVHVHELWRSLKLAIVLLAALVCLLGAGVLLAVLADSDTTERFDALGLVATQLRSVFSIETDGIDVATSPAAASLAYNQIVSRVDDYAQAGTRLRGAERSSVVYTAVFSWDHTSPACPSCSELTTSVSFHELSQLLVDSAYLLAPDDTCVSPGGVGSTAFTMLREVELPLTTILWDMFNTVTVINSATNTVLRASSLLFALAALIAIPLIYHMLKQNVFAAFVAQEMLVKALIAMVPEESLKKNYLLSLMCAQVSKDDLQLVE